MPKSKTEVAREDDLARKRAYYQSHAKECRRKGREYYHSHVEDRRVHDREFYRNHGHRKNPKQKQWGRDSNLRRMYGITQDQFNQLLLEQGGKCAICSTDSPGGRTGVFNVDHDHRTNRIRGLLCHRCNLALGFLDDDPHRLYSAFKYLRMGVV